MKATSYQDAPPPLRLVELLAVAALVIFSAWVRTDTADRDEVFSRAPSAGLLKSDPGLLYYLTERVAEAKGATPEDWRADPRIAHPELVDVPSDYTVGQEFLFGWSWRWFGAGTPLQRWCHLGSSILAALAVIGVWGLARELCANRGAALLAAGLYLLLPASYRTIGFVLIREDLSLPLFALHLWCTARALRLRTPASIALASSFAALALGTWHAMGFVLLMEALVVVFLGLLRGFALSSKQALALLAPILLAWLLIPVVGGGGLWLLLCLVLSVPLATRFAPGRVLPVAALVSVGGGALIVLLGNALGADDFSHVHEVLFAKLRHGGRLPTDPTQLSFDARLLWQGPFATLEPAAAFAILGVALGLALPACIESFLSRRTLPTALALFSLLSLTASWLVLRVSVLPAILLPPLIVFAFLRWRGRLVAAAPASDAEDQPRSLKELGASVLTWAGAGLFLWQAMAFQGWREDLRLFWYRPERDVVEIAEMVQGIREHVPPGEAVAADFINSTAILSQTGRPSILQPKWERSPARARVQRFWETFYHGSPEQFASLLREDFDCRYLLIDRDMLWVLRASKYCAGIPAHQAQPPAGTAAEGLLQKNPGDGQEFPPGYELLWSGNPREPDSLGAMRLFRLD